MSEVDRFTTSLGAYLLGALPGSERAAVEGHLAGCSACREELAGLAGLPGLLSLLEPDDVHRLDGSGQPPGARPLDRTLHELARRRRVQRRRARLLAAAASLVVFGLAGVLLAGSRGTQPRPSDVVQRSASATDSRSGVQGVVQVSRQPWGTALRLSLRGVPPGTHCELVAVLIDGQRRAAGAWQASYEGTASVAAATDARPDQLASVEVFTAAGVRLLAIPLRGA